MTRLKHLLLAGTMVPALVLMPMANAFAQQGPDAGERSPHQRPEGAGQHAAPGGEHAQPGREAPSRAAPAAPPGRAEHQAPAQRTAPAAPNRAERPGPAERAAPSHAERPEQRAAPTTPAAPNHAERPSPTERGAASHAERPEPAQRAAPAAPAAPNRAERPTERTAPNHPEHAAPAQVAPGAPRGESRGAAATPNEPGRAPGQPQRDQATAPRDQRGPEAGRPGEPNHGPMAGQPGAAAGNPNTAGRAPDQRHGGISPGGAAAIGAAAGFAGGFLAATGAQNLDAIRRDRRETVEDGRTYIREPGRTIVEDGGRSYVVHDENDRFRQLGYDVRRERDGDDYIDRVDRPDGTQIITYTTADGRLLRRVRRGRDGREYVLIDNAYDGRVRPYQDDIVDLPPPRVEIPRDRYVVDYQDADEGVLYDTFIAPPLQAPPRRYTLDQIRYSPDVRRYVRSVDINTINFDTGSWIVPASATGKLQALATAVKRTIARNPNSVFLVEGFTDATGNPADNLSLSDRRAQSVAAILSKDFGVPPENLTTQGYGQQNLKENTQGPSAVNRRVVVQNITPLLAAGGQPPR